MEIFKDITGYKGLYQISNKGRVKSFAHTVNGNKAFWLNQYMVVDFILDLKFTIPKKIYSKDRLGWSYSDKSQVLVIEYCILWFTFYKIHSQSVLIADYFTRKKPLKIEKRREDFIEIGVKEFREEYQSNRYLIPLNYKFNPELL